ncbi:MAG: twin-arginine translocase subunit TatC [Spirochaetales bacterium]|nr:twin-arginine translocase subunit TatC [Spirochaetales bacterium]
MNRIADAPGRAMTFLEHVRELRKRIIISLMFTLTGGIVCYIFSNTVVDLLYYPFRNLESFESLQNKFYVTTIFEGFVMKMKIAFLGGIIMNVPVYAFHLIRFFFPGLSNKEKKVVIMTLASGSVLAGLGLYYGYFHVIPLSIRVLTGGGFVPSIVGMLLNFEKNILYVLQFIFAFIIIFQTPIVLVILMALDLVKRRDLLKFSRYVIVVIFIIAAVLTPPDFVSQLCMAVPLVLLYFAAILVARVFRLGG